MHHISKMDVKPCSWEREPDGWRAAPNGSKRGVFVRKKGKIEHFKRLHIGHVHKGNWEIPHGKAKISCQKTI